MLRWRRTLAGSQTVESDFGFNSDPIQAGYRVFVTFILAVLIQQFNVRCWFLTMNGIFTSYVIHTLYAQNGFKSHSDLGGHEWSRESAPRDEEQGHAVSCYKGQGENTKFGGAPPGLYVRDETPNHRCVFRTHVTWRTWHQPLDLLDTWNDECNGHWWTFCGSPIHCNIWIVCIIVSNLSVPCPWSVEWKLSIRHPLPILSISEHLTRLKLQTNSASPFGMSMDWVN